jgi:hypothetical protein
MFTAQDAAGVAGAAWHQATRDNHTAHNTQAVSASQLHECPRALHYRAQGTPATDQVGQKLNLLAHFGTAVHDFYLPYLAGAWLAQDAVADADIEPTIETTAGGVRIVAHPDLVITYNDGTASILELKTTGRAGVDAALAGEPKTAHLDQCRLGAALIEHTTGTPVVGYWIYYLDRADPERHWALVDRPWNNTEAQRGADLIDYAARVGAHEGDAPRWFGTARSDAHAPHSPCLACPWQSQCLGKDPADPVRGEAADELLAAIDTAGTDIDSAEAALAEFLARTAEVEKYRKGKSHLVDLVEHLGLEPGDYHIRGSVKTLVWREGHDRTDTAACVKILEGLGTPVPKSRTSGYYQLK